MYKNSKQFLVWRHNSFLGHAAMMRKQCLSIMQAETSTEEAQTLAREIYDKAWLLSLALKERR